MFLERLPNRGVGGLGPFETLRDTVSDDAFETVLSQCRGVDQSAKVGLPTQGFFRLARNRANIASTDFVAVIWLSRDENNIASCAA